MIERGLICGIIFVYLMWHVIADCRIEDSYDDCYYTIVCESTVAPVALTNCTAPNPTLLIKNSSLDNVSNEFFNGSNFGQHIKTLKAINNRWTHIEPFAFSLTNCTRMDLSGNGIKSVHGSSFAHMILLKELNLSRNAIETWDPRCITGTGVPLNVTVLDLSFNLLNNLTAEEMACFPELQILYLQGNRLSSLSGVFINLVYLNYLYVSNNQLTTLSGILDNLRYLKIFDVSVNKVKRLNANDLRDNEALEQIVLTQNEIESIDPTIFRNTINVEAVDISNNSVKTLTLTLLDNTELKYLNFHHNNISFLNCSLSPSSKNLESVDFSLNNLTEFTASAISNAYSLKLLNLSSNSLTSVKYDSFVEFQNLTVLDLSNNELDELDAKVFNEHFNLKKLILDDNTIKKLDFDNLIAELPQLKVISVGGNLIPCRDMLEHYDKGLRNNVSVTAIKKVLDRSNVHGISCDNVTRPGVTTQHEPLDLMNIVLIWSGVMLFLVVILLISGIWACVSKSRKSRHTTYDTEMEPRGTEPPESSSWQEIPVESRL